MECSLRWVVLRGAIMMLLLQGMAMVYCANVVKADGLQRDTQGLLSFKQRIEKDAFGMLEGWGAGATNSCEWRGVTCVNGRVAVLDLSNGGLLAPLPASTLAPLDQLRELQLQGNAFYGYGIEQVVDVACNTLTVLDLSSNNLTGGFSGSANVLCTTLTYLNLSHNAFSGSLSSFGLVGAESSLITLDLSYNNFSGSFPSQVFSNCGSLAWLDLSHNSLMGGIPDGVSACATLLHLDLSYNLLNSTLPQDIISPISSTDLDASTSLTYLNLSTNRLIGSLPDTLNSPVLLSLDLSTNLFVGLIPPSLSASAALRVLNLSFNNLSGPLPPSLSSLTNLRGLYLTHNNLTGSIPSEFGSSFAALEELDLSANKLVGTVPASFSNLSVLHYLNLRTNFISGEFPKTVVCAMPALSTLIISFNNLTGALPPEGLADCRLLSKLDLSANGLTGGLPAADSFCGPQLQQLLLQDNALVGTIPEALGNCTSLTILDLSCNLLGGPLPPTLARLPLLQELMIWGNALNGPISSSFGAAFYLNKLILNINFLSGTIPPALGNCSNLEWLSLSSNLLSGIIPPELGFITKLGILQLANNTLTGPIPASLGSCNKLIWLDLNNNLLEGTIPVDLTKQAGKVTRGTLNQGTEYRFIRNLDRECRGLGGLLEYNGIRDGTLSELNSVKQACNVTLLYHGRNPYYFPATGGGSLEYLDLGYNRLTGTIPPELGLLRYLLVLSLSHNALTGPIPDSLSNLALLAILFLDHNMLQGPIPPSLASLGLVNQLDFSNNNLSGPIPQTGKMVTMPASVFANNPGLCGSPLPPCGYTSTSGNSDSPFSSRGRSSAGWSAVTIGMSSVGALAVVTAFACGMAACFGVKKHKMRQNMQDSYMDKLPSGSDSNSWNIAGAGQPLSINVATFEKPLRKLTFAHLLEATNGFSAKVVIGRGGFGDVYKATLEGGVVVAIKKLVHAIGQGDREFMAEMETLGKIKHRNLVPLLGYCKVGQERLLVYEYMEGGSLDKKLHGDSMDSDESDTGNGGPRGHASLSWEMRKRIALGTARGLCFLHHSCIPHIIHRDLKSSNVLLDDTLEARVSDFGMARLVSAAETHLSVSSVVGTPGYVPPEYCHSFRCTTKGDVYSFGVVLLELITGKRPTWSSSSKRAKSKGGSSQPSPIMSGSDGGSTSTTSGGSVMLNLCAPIREDSGEDEESAGGVDLVGWVNKQLKAGKPRVELLDQTALLNGGGAIIPLNKSVVEKEMLRYLDIAYWCVEQSPHKRPNMLEVMSLFRELNQDQDLDPP